MKDKVAAVVLTFRPTPDVEDNIAEILRQVDHVFIINNESVGSCLFPSLEGNSRVLLHHNRENLGVATGFNQGIQYAMDAGYDYVILFDQDSFPGEKMVFMLANFCVSSSPMPLIAGPTLYDFKSKRLIGSGPSLMVDNTDIIISSGMMVSRAAIEKLGVYKDELFIDFVDHEYCLRAQAAGVPVIRLRDAVLYHSFGKSTEVHFLGRQFFLTEYPSIRHYYRARNFLYLFSKYGGKGWAWKECRYFFKEWLKILLWESDAIRKSEASIKGFMAYFRGEIE